MAEDIEGQDGCRHVCAARRNRVQGEMTDGGRGKGQARMASQTRNISRTKEYIGCVVSRASVRSRSSGHQGKTMHQKAAERDSTSQTAVGLSAVSCRERLGACRPCPAVCYKCCIYPLWLRRHRLRRL
jgi:hypothetical protein